MRVGPYLLLCLASAATGCGFAPEATSLEDSRTARDDPPSETCATTVLVVRHAERADADGTDEDPRLSDAGERRARDLVEVASGAGVSAIYTTRYRRTRDTARPVAEALGVRVVVFDSDASSPEAESVRLAHHIQDRHRCQVVLVVGHSNTVPAIVQALGVGDVGAIAADRYDDLFVVTFTEAGKTRLVQARYGAPSGR